MSNFDRAVKALNYVDEVIDRVAGNEVYATALEAAGLLSPDLPEPDGPYTLVPAGVAWNTPQDSIVWTALGGRVVLQWVSPGNFTPHEARELALAVLSAADYAEKEQGND